MIRCCRRSKRFAHFLMVFILLFVVRGDQLLKKTILAYERNIFRIVSIKCYRRRQFICLYERRKNGMHFFCPLQIQYIYTDKTINDDLVSPTFVFATSFKYTLLETTLFSKRTRHTATIQQKYCKFMYIAFCFNIHFYPLHYTLKVTVIISFFLCTSSKKKL